MALANVYVKVESPDVKNYLGNMRLRLAGVPEGDILNGGLKNRADEKKYMLKWQNPRTYINVQANLSADDPHLCSLNVVFLGRRFTEAKAED